VCSSDLAESPVEQLRLKLHDLDPEAAYAVTVFGVPGTTKATGRELMDDGLPIVLSGKPAAAVVLYSRQR
jgi:hypothetical protein